MFVCNSLRTPFFKGYFLIKYLIKKKLRLDSSIVLDFLHCMDCRHLSLSHTHTHTHTLYLIICHFVLDICLLVAVADLSEYLFYGPGHPVKTGIYKMLLLFYI